MLGIGCIKELRAKESHVSLGCNNVVRAFAQRCFTDVNINAIRILDFFTGSPVSVDRFAFSMT